MPSLAIGRHRIVPGRYYNTPKEVWGFRLDAAPGPPDDLARGILAANAELLGLEGVLRTLRRSRRGSAIASLGGWHAIFSQWVAGYRVHRAYVTVHMNRSREAYLIKSRAVPRDFLPGPTEKHEIRRAEARRLAIRAVARGRTVTVVDPEQLWFPRRTRLRPAFKFRVLKQSPRQEWIVYVDAVDGHILSKYDNLALASGFAKIFNPNPVVALAGSHDLLDEESEPVAPPEKAYERVRLAGLAKTGFLDGARVTTRLTRPRMKRQPGFRFEFRSDQRGFDEAMVYFHIDTAVRYLQSLGYRGPRAVFTKAIETNAHGTTEDNSWYSPGLRTLTFGTGGVVDAAEDGEVILHEFGHALQDAICSDFGQSPEAAAMGEGFGDYFAASMSAEKKIENRASFLLARVMSWDGILLGDPPGVRALDEKVTYETFNHAASADEHDNGLIWSAALWDIWEALGRKIADRIIIDSHFQLDGFTGFAKGARAILDADRNLFNGRHVGRLQRIFHRRGIGPVE